MVLGDFDGDKNIDAICWFGQYSKFDIILNINSRQGKTGYPCHVFDNYANNYANLLLVRGSPNCFC